MRDRQVLERKAEVIRTMFHRLLGREGLSCSIGIAVSPEDGENYLTLFQNADAALYYAKEKGKNQFASYRRDMGWKGRREKLSGSGGGRDEKIESEQSQGFHGGDLATYVFRMLYEAEDVGRAIGLLLEIVGRQMGVSRAYVFELAEDGTHIRNTFEWCAEGISSEIGNLQHVAMEEIRGPLRQVMEEGVLYCRDISQLSEGDGSRAILESQGIKAMLQCAIRNGGAFHGLVGFDDCRNTHIWTKRQVETLTLVADIVGTFLLRCRTQERSEKLVRDLSAIPDHQRAWIYVVAANTYEILYANCLTRSVLPDMAAGELCYRAFYGRETSCEDCPLSRLGPDGSGGGRLYSEVVGGEVDARVNTITRQGERKGYLMSCLPAEDAGEENA